MMSSHESTTYTPAKGIGVKIEPGMKVMAFCEGGTGLNGVVCHVEPEGCLVRPFTEGEAAELEGGWGVHGDSSGEPFFACWPAVYAHAARTPAGHGVEVEPGMRVWAHGYESGEALPGIVRHVEADGCLVRTLTGHELGDNAAGIQPGDGSAFFATWPYVLVFAEGPAEREAAQASGGIHRRA